MVYPLYVTVARPADQYRPAQLLPDPWQEQMAWILDHVDPGATVDAFDRALAEAYFDPHFYQAEVRSSWAHAFGSHIARIPDVFAAELAALPGALRERLCEAVAVLSARAVLITDELRWEVEWNDLTRDSRRGLATEMRWWLRRSGPSKATRRAFLMWAGKWPHKHVRREGQLREELPDVLQAALSDLSPAVHEWSRFFRYSGGGYLLVSTPYIDWLPELARVMDATAQPADARWLATNYIGVSYALERHDHRGATAFAYVVDHGLVVVVPKGTTDADIAKMLPDMPTIAPYVPAWHRLRDRLLAETTAATCVEGVKSVTQAASLTTPLSDDAPHSMEECRMARDAVVARLKELGKANQIVGESLAIMQIYPVLARICRDRSARFNVLLLGAPGTGKQVVAETIHALTARKGKFVQRNSATLLRETLTAELFGAVRGAFTGAVPREGAFGHAAEGVLFLDNMQNASREAQSAILNAIEDAGVYTKMGGHEQEKVTCCFVAAINEDMGELERSGRVLHDLRRRFHHVVRLPLLEERRDDVPILVEHLVSRTLMEQHLQLPPTQKRELVTKAGEVCARLDLAQCRSTNIGALAMKVREVVLDFDTQHRVGSAPPPAQAGSAVDELVAQLGVLIADGRTTVTSQRANWKLRDAARNRQALQECGGSPEAFSRALGYSVLENLDKALSRFLR